MRKCRIVSGARDSGKTSYISALGISQGIITLSENPEKNTRYLSCLSDGTKHDFMTRMNGRYVVSEGAFEWAHEKLSRIGSGIAAIDECGMIELREKRGFHDSITALMEKEEVTLYVSVRDAFLPLFLSVFAPDEYDVIML